MLKLRVASRGSRLSLIQVEEALTQLSKLMKTKIEWDVLKVKTRADLWQEKPLHELGGPGVFTKEVDKALIDGRADIAVHSLKDIPVSGREPDTEIVFIAPRPSSRDALIVKSGSVSSVEDLAPGSIVGTSSVRRRALTLHYNWNIEVRNLRGNLDTRLRKLNEGLYDAIIVSEAGLIRLGYKGGYTPLDPKRFPPAPGQGFIAVTALRDSEEALKIRGALGRLPWYPEAEAERALLEAVGAGCKNPVGGVAIRSGDKLLVLGVILDKEGEKAFWARSSGSTDEARSLGLTVGSRLYEALDVVGG